MLTENDKVQEEHSSVSLLNMQRVNNSNKLCNKCSTYSNKIKTLKKNLHQKSINFHNLKQKYRKVLNDIQKLKQGKANSENSISQFLTKDQIKFMGVKKMQKWHNKTIKKALQLKFSCGQTGYNTLLKQNYPLPSIRTLNRKIEHIKFEPGILSEIFHYLQSKVSLMQEHEKLCALTFDEMSIIPAIEIDKTSKAHIGYITIPNQLGSATHGLVFMLSGITTRWKQIVVHHLTGNSISGDTIANIILQIIEFCNNIDLKVCSVTSDMGSCNRAAWNKLGIVCSHSNKTVATFKNPTSPEGEIKVFADVPHLMKNLRNHLTNKQEILVPEDIASANTLVSKTVSIIPVQQLLDYQETKQLKLAPKLSPKHLNLSHFNKMKVNYAMQIFSHAVASAIRFLVQLKILPENYCMVH